MSRRVVATRPLGGVRLGGLVTAVAAAALLLAAAPSAALAQEPPEERRPVRTEVRERALERLRALERASRVESEPDAADAEDGLDAAEVEADPDRPADPAAAEPDPDEPDGRPVVPVEAVRAAADTQRDGRPRHSPRVRIPGDTVFDALLGLEGYTVLTYEGAAARFDVETGVVELDGKAEVDRDGQHMTVDSLLRFNQQTAVICGYGKPVLTGQDAKPVESELVCYDLDRQVGMARSARTTFQEGAEWFVFSEEAYPVGSERLYSHSARFTSCDLDEPHYHFGARSIKIVHDDVLVARNVTLSFGDVPVFWLPFMVQSLKSGRRSGLLKPSFSVNDIARTRSDYNRRIRDLGFYWAINDYMGARVAFDWFSNEYSALQGGLDFGWKRQFLDGNVFFSRFWQADGRRQLTLRSRANWRPGENTQLRGSVDYASSSGFVQRYSFDPMELNQTIDSDVGLTQRFDWGNLTVGVRRRQHITDDRVDLVLPSASLTLSPITMFRAAPDGARFYNNMTWTGRGSFESRSTSMDLTRPGPGFRDQSTVSASASSSISMGNLSWGQSASLRQHIRDAKPPVGEHAALERELTQDVNWSTNLSYRIRLIGSTTLSPGVSMSGLLKRNPESEDELVAGPRTINFNTNLSTDIFGFWPGFGGYSRIRHKLSPTISYRYQPAVTATQRQIDVFGVADIGERNEITIGLNQTFEAKRREAPADERAPGAEDGAVDGEEQAEDEPRDPDAPRRLPRAETITLLSLTTSAVAYDFVQAREMGDGWRTMSITNTLLSDLLPGLNVSFTHELWEARDAEPARLGPFVRLTTPPDPLSRRFAPHLRDVRASFSLDANFWLFRLFGLAPGRDADRRREPSGGPPEMDLDEDGAPVRPGRLMTGMEDDRSARIPTGVGPWRASLNYTLNRPRDRGEGAFGRGSQMLSGNVSFRPTPNWSVHWSTAYNFTQGEFSNHVLTLTRDLHRWEANFDFVKTQTGNFAFQFRVSLRDNPDIEFDYEQRDPIMRPGAPGF